MKNKSRIALALLSVFTFIALADAPAAPPAPGPSGPNCGAPGTPTGGPSGGCPNNGGGLF